MFERAAWLTALALVFALGLSAPAGAHRFAPSLLTLRELGSGAVGVSWKTPLLAPTGAALRPVLPERCVPIEAPRASRAGGGALLGWRIDCGAAGLVGETVGAQGLARSRSSVLVRVELADGRRLQRVLQAGRSTWVIPEREPPAQVARGTFGLGALHIATGIDHLLFVLALVLLVRGGRRLLLTVTAFTAGHSATLCLAVLGVVDFPAGPVELAIALSVLLLALELTRPSPSRGLLAHRPWVVAGLFGLLHGLGFAGALSAVGLPAGEIPIALLGFNLGIEAGQVAFIGLVLAGAAALRPLARRGPAWLARVPAYAIGSLAALFCFDRLAALL